VDRVPPAEMLLKTSGVELAAAPVAEVVGGLEVVTAVVVTGELLVVVALLPPQPATTKTMLIRETAMAIDDLVFIRFRSFY
jgi:hypothetical protein